MSAEPNLTGARILVVEDDYLLALDAESALRRAGAEVVGPFPNEAEAIKAIQQGGLHAAVNDVNLGLGPSFETARALRNASVPFLFLTGYDPSSFPPEFADVPRLMKPIDSRHLVKELARLLVRE